MKDRTRVELDGERIAIGRLKQGQDVHVSFDLRGDQAIAIEIAASPSSIAPRSNATAEASTCAAVAWAARARRTSGDASWGGPADRRP